MDPLSFAASLSALATIAFQLVSYIGSVKDGGDERKKLATQLTTLWMVLQQLQTQFATDLASDDQLWTAKLKILQQPGGVLDQIGAELTSLQDKLQSKKGWQKLSQSLKWPLTKADVDRAVQQIYQLHQLLTGVLGQANIALAQEIRKDAAEVKDLIVGDELKTFLDWISPLSFLQRQQLFFRESRTGTGKWFLDDEQYQQWEVGNGSIMWCPGIPGAGKSFLSSIVIDKLQTLQKAQVDQKTLVLIVYFAFDDANSQLSELVLGSLLKQVLQYRLDVPQELRMDFRKHRNDGTRPSYEEIVKALKNALGQFERIYVVMDALDELLEEKKRREIVEAVINLNEKINLLVTSRPIENIRKIFSDGSIWCDECEFDPNKVLKPHEYFYHCVDCEDTVSYDLCQACYDKGVSIISPAHEGHEFVRRYCSLSIEILARDEDIQSYVEWRIEGHDSLKRCVDKKIGLRNQILERVIESAQGMFLLARFHMDSLVTKLTPRAVIKALETLPTETDTTYEKAMQRINDMNPDFREKAKLFLLWVAYTYRPLSTREIEHATTVLPDETDFDADEIIPAKALASMCAGLVIIDEMDNVRLCHYTVENYFQKVRGELFVDADISLARTCLTYLLLDEFEAGRCADVEFDQRSKSYPFLGYASSNWGRHAAVAENQSLEEQVLVFLNSEPHRDAATQAIWHLDAAGYLNWDAKSGATGLHLASYFGLVKAVESLIAEKEDINAQDSLGTTPLMYAAFQGHEKIVERLLNGGANPNTVCSRGGTALHRAALQNYVGIVRLLLAQKNLDVNTLHSGWGRESALMLAAEYGYADVVKELLGRADIKINDLGGGYTALHLAVQYDQGDPIKLLIADPLIDLEVRNQGGWPALIMAARYGHIEVAEALLNAGADIDKSDSELDGGGTAILRAIDYNRLPMVQLLYNRGANWDSKDKYNRSLIHGAAVNNCSQILRWLLETQEGFEVNLQDVNGKTALHDAAFLGYDDCITVLLDFSARTDIRDRAGKTPLRTAKEHNNLSSYELLQAARNEEIKSLQRSGTLVEVIEMPLCTAAFIGDSARVQMFIDRAKSDPGSGILEQTDDGLVRNSIAAAVENGHLDVVDMLIAAGVNVNHQDRLGRTALHGCAMYGRYSITISLVKAHADVDLSDQWDKSPLSMALSYDERSIINVLLEHGAKIDDQEQYLHFLLFNAAKLGNNIVVKRLLGMGADAQRKNPDGKTALQLARQFKHEETVQLLLEWDAKNL